MGVKNFEHLKEQSCPSVSNVKSADVRLTMPLKSKISDVFAA